MSGVLDVQSITEINLAQDTNPFWRYVMQIWMTMKALFKYGRQKQPKMGYFLSKNTNLLKLRHSFEISMVLYLNAENM